MEFSVFKWTRKDLLFVVSVVLVVYAVSAFQLKTGEMKTRDVQRKADVEQVGRALNAYASDHSGLYPNVVCGEYTPCVWGNSKIVDSDGVVYLKDLPKDPSEKREYVYQVSFDKHAFKIYVALENLSDPGLRRGLTTECGYKVQCNWYVTN